MDILNLILTITKGLDFIKSITAIAEALGLDTKLVNAALSAVSAVRDIIENTLKRIDEGKLVASASDAASIKRLAEELSKENEKLMAYIANS